MAVDGEGKGRRLISSGKMTAPETSQADRLHNRAGQASRQVGGIRLGRRLRYACVRPMSDSRPVPIVPHSRPQS